MHLKNLFQKNEFQHYTVHRGPPVYIRNSFFFNNGVKKQDPGFQMRIHNTGDELHSAGP
jgi:hypothetical protein